MSADQSNTPIVVIGAGLAGLAAALELKDHGHTSVVLEARGRVGGRVHTVRDPFADGLHGEAGAEYINGGHTHVQTLLRRFGLLSGRAPSAPRLYRFHGRQTIGRTVAAFGPEVANDLRKLGRRTAALGRAVPDPHSPWTALTAADLDHRSVAEWLDDLGLSPLTLSYLSVWHRLDYSIDNDQISLLQLARDDRLYRNEPTNSVGRPREGMDALPRAMAAELGNQVKLCTQVVSLSQDAGGVTIRYRQHGAVASILAARVVVAIPTGALRDIAFDPKLPPTHRESLGGLRYGTVVKVLLQFRRRFWLDQQRIRGIMSDLPFLSAWDATRDQPGDRGILGTYTAGSNGRKLVEMPETERIQWCVAQIDQVFPGAARLFETGYAAVWDREKFTRGTYSYFAPGEMTRIAPHLAQRVGRIHFAGEHTDAWQATMNGAIASGLRAATEIMQESALHR